MSGPGPGGNPPPYTPGSETVAQPPDRLRAYERERGERVLAALCGHFIESTDAWGGTYCKRAAGHGGEHSAFFDGERLRDAGSTVRYGPLEVRGEREEQFVSVPGVFLAAPPQDLPVRTRTVADWGRKRIEEWVQDGRLRARWRWATEAE